MIHIPGHFAENDTATLHALIRRHNFGTPVLSHRDELRVSHPPFQLDGGRNVLRAHMARANPQWRAFSPDREVLAIFQGPHHYISPSWYGSHLSVPTWNYAVVHAHGRPVLIEDCDALEALMRKKSR